MSTPGSLTSGEDVIIQQQADGSWKEFDGMNAGHLFGPGARPSFIVRKYALNGGTGVDAFRVRLSLSLSPSLYDRHL